MDDQLYRNPDLAQFYDLENVWDMDMDDCARLAKDAASVLDLGCGTGMFLSRLAGARQLVGVDPAAAMLSIARRQPGADTVTWIEADARNVRPNDQLFSASSKIKFRSKDQIASMIKQAGLFVDTWFGEWHGTPWQNSSYDIIPLGRMA